MRGRRSESQQEHTEAGMGHNGGPPQASQTVLLKLLDEYDDADQAVAEKVGLRKDLRKRILGAGLNLTAFDRARKLADQSGEQRETEDHELRRYMAWMGKPLGHQAEIFAAPEPGPSGNGHDDAAVSEHQVHRVDTGGFVAGKAGRDRGGNPWTPGTFLYQIWNTGWVRGQEALAQTLVDEPKRRPGRPPGAKNKNRSAPPDGAAEA